MRWNGLGLEAAVAAQTACEAESQDGPAHNQSVYQRHPVVSSRPHPREFRPKYRLPGKKISCFLAGPLAALLDHENKQMASRLSMLPRETCVLPPEEHDLLHEALIHWHDATVFPDERVAQVPQDLHPHELFIFPLQAEPPSGPVA